MVISFSGQNVKPLSFDKKDQQSNVNRKAQFNNQPLKDSVRFTSNNTNYENPVNKGWEYFSAVTGPAIFSVAAGAVAGLLAKKEGAKGLLNYKTGGIVAGIAALLTIPVAIYQRSVSAFAKTKEMDVFAREKSAETSLTEQIDQKARDEDVPLDDAINSYTKFEIGKNGRAMGIVNT